MVVLSPFDIPIRGVNPTRDPELVEADQSWLEVPLDGSRLVEFWIDDRTFDERRLDERRLDESKLDKTRLDGTRLDEPRLEERRIE